MHDGMASSREIRDRAEQADVVILIETAPPALRALKPLGWDERFPYSVGDLKDDISNTAIFSRFPLSKGELLGRTSFQQWLTTIQAPGIGDITLVAAHPCNPYCGGNHWAIEHADIRARIQPLLQEPLIVAGDLNAVDEHGPLQALRADGLQKRDGHHRGGLGADLPGRPLVPAVAADRPHPGQPAPDRDGPADHPGLRHRSPGLDGHDRRHRLSRTRLVRP